MDRANQEYNANNSLFKDKNLTKKELIKTIRVINYKLDVICEYIFMNKFNNGNTFCEILSQSDNDDNEK